MGAYLEVLQCLRREGARPSWRSHKHPLAAFPSQLSRKLTLAAFRSRLSRKLAFAAFRDQLVRRALLVAACAPVVVAGCGGGEGVEDGATATVYVAAGACYQAQRALETKGPEVGSVRLRVKCLPGVEKHGHFDLAQIGANARQATEDSTTIAYIRELEPRAVRFSETILEEAGIAQLPETPGAVAMAKLFQALERAEGRSGSLRQSVNDELG
jgi:hypothetical protein